MDLFSDFSFSKPSSLRHCVSSQVDIAPYEELSPRSSRDPSPFSSAEANPSPHSSLVDLTSMTNFNNAYELNQRLPSAYPTPGTISGRLLGMDKKRRQAREYFDTVRERRQSATRLQCDPRRAASIRNYVERFLAEGSASYGSRHPSSSLFGEYPMPPTSAPTESIESDSTGSDSADEGAEAIQALTLGDSPAGSDRFSTRSTSSRRRRSYAVSKNSNGRVKPGSGR